MAQAQYNATTKLLHWFIPDSDQTTVESEFLRDLLHLWQQKAFGFRQLLGGRYDTLYSILGAWITERLAVVDISAKLTSGSELPHSMPRAKEEFDALNTLRVEKLTLLQACPDDKLRSGLLAEALSILTDTKGVESVFLYGIRRLHQDDMVMLGMIESWYYSSVRASGLPLKRREVHCSHHNYLISNVERMSPNSSQGKISLDHADIYIMLSLTWYAVEVETRGNNIVMAHW
jgi:hypothetical protein